MLCNTLNMEILRINSSIWEGFDTQKAHCISVTKPIWLLIFRESPFRLISNTLCEQ